MMYWIFVCCFHDCICMSMDMDVLIWVLEWYFLNLCMMFSLLYLYVHRYKCINLSVKIVFEVFVCVWCFLKSLCVYVCIWIFLCSFHWMYFWLNLLVSGYECIDLSVRMMLFWSVCMCMYAFESLYVVLVECIFYWIRLYGYEYIDLGVRMMFFEVFVCVCMHLNLCMLFSLNVFFIVFVCVNMNKFFGVFM